MRRKSKLDSKFAYNFLDGKSELGEAGIDFGGSDSTMLVQTILVESSKATIFIDFNL